MFRCCRSLPRACKIWRPTTPSRFRPPRTTWSPTRCCGTPIACRASRHLPRQLPPKQRSKLERAVTTLEMNGAMLCGRTRKRNLDHRDFWPIFEAAAALNAPLYIHPQSPLPAVRAAYYSGFDDAVDAAFATYGIGWHYETGIQLLRLILSGVFDRFPGLQVIVGHWGEMVLFYLERIEHLARAAKLEPPYRLFPE